MRQEDTHLILATPSAGSLYMHAYIHRDREGFITHTYVERVILYILENPDKCRTRGGNVAV